MRLEWERRQEQIGQVAREGAAEQAPKPEAEQIR
jgi:hypothetical protein